MVSAKDFKQEMITEDMKQAALAVFVTMAIVETIKPIVTGYQKAILEYEKYSYAKKHHGKRCVDSMEYISDAGRTYLMEDEDFKHFMKRCREEQAKAKLHTDDPECCPLLVAEHDVLKAQWLLIDSMEPLTGIGQEVCGNMENFRKYIDLTLRLLAPFVPLHGSKNIYLPANA